jgi:hypothetical protein
VTSPPPRRSLFQRLLPWAISIASLYYVFHVTNWARLVEATERANLPLFITFAALDKLVFFAVWSWVSIEAIRRFVTPAPRPQLLALRGASEGFRALNNPLADAAFLVGVSRMIGGRLDALVAAAVIPFVLHFLVLLAQATLVLPFVAAGPESTGVRWMVIFSWVALIAVALLVRASRHLRLPFVEGVRRWLEGLPLSRLAPFFGWFIGLAFFDVLIQGLASRSFGIELEWLVLTSRLPLLYLALSLPSVGNFGVREFAWAHLFGDQAPQDALIAYAFAMNALFVVFHVLIGAVFIRRAFDLLAEVRAERRRGQTPRLRDALRE